MKKFVKIDHLWFQEYMDWNEIDTAISQCVYEIKQYLKIYDCYLICVLDGGSPFFNELFFKLGDIIKKVDFVKVSSYGDNFQSMNKIDFILKPSITPEEYKDKKIIIVDDIVDSGNTMVFLKDFFEKELGVKRAYTCSLLYKENNNYTPDIYGKKVPNDFLIGFGLDYKGRYRNLKEILKMTEI